MPQHGLFAAVATTSSSPRRAAPVWHPAKVGPVRGDHGQRRSGRRLRADCLRGRPLVEAARRSGIGADSRHGGRVVLGADQGGTVRPCGDSSKRLRRDAPSGAGRTRSLGARVGGCPRLCRDVHASQERCPSSDCPRRSRGTTGLGHHRRLVSRLSRRTLCVERLSWVRHRRVHGLHRSAHLHQKSSESFEDFVPRVRLRRGFRGVTEFRTNVATTETGRPNLEAVPPRSSASSQASAPSVRWTERAVLVIALGLPPLGSWERRQVCRTPRRTTPSGPCTGP